jgi:hypothetical protein
MLMTYFCLEPQSPSSPVWLSGLPGIQSLQGKVSIMPLSGHLRRHGLKGTDSLPESWMDWPNPLLKTIKQLRAFLRVIGLCRIWIPRYAPLAKPLFMLLLMILFGPCIINALSQLLARNIDLCLCMSSPSCSIGGLWRLHGSTPETSTTTPTLPRPVAPLPAWSSYMSHCPSPQQQLGTCLRGGTCWVWRPKGQMSEYPSPIESTMIPKKKL